MIRSKRPLLGRLTLLALTTSLAISALACAKKEVEDSWQMTPPVFETNSGSGIRLKIKSNQMTARNSVADDTAVLIFATADRGLEMQVSSLCSTPQQQTEEVKMKRKTTSAVAVLSLLPPKVLSPESLKVEWNCELRFHVTNEHGSNHDFEILNMTVHLASLADRIAKSPLIVNASSNSALSKLLICPSWWVEAANMSLDAMANFPAVNGADNRDIERQPLCTVVESPAAPRVVGFFRPVFNSPKISISPAEVLIPATELTNLYHRPLFSWTVRNDSRLTQTLFIATPADAITIAPVMTWIEPYNGVFDPVRTFPLFTATGAEETRQTPLGFYAQVQPGATIVLQANSSRSGITSLVDFSRKLGSSHLVVIGNNLAVMTLANQREFSSLSRADSRMLDTAMRDPGGFSLLKAIVLEPDLATGKLTYGKTNVEALNTKKRVPGTDCFDTKTFMQPNAPACF